MTKVDDIIRIVESVDAHRQHVITILEIDQGPPPRIVPDDRLFGIGVEMRRLHGGEWVGNFETGVLHRV